MNRRIYFFAFIILTAFFLGCSGDPTENANSDDGNAAEERFAHITDPKAALAEGDRLFDGNETELAIDAYRQAVKLDPDLAEAHFKLGIAYALIEAELERTGVVQEAPANSNGEKAVRIKPKSQKSFENAVEAYKKWLSDNPKDDVAYFNLGRAYNKLNKDEEAEEAFREAVKLKPDDTEYQTELGAILIKLAEYREAIGPLKKAIELDPENSRAINLHDDAEAGRSRIDYQPPANDAKGTANANANSNSANVNAVNKPVNAAPTPQKNDPKIKPPANAANKPSK
jgi:tetratricopeptide (TPR) repeat protein